MNKNKLFKILSLVIAVSVVLSLMFFVFPNTVKAGVLDDFSMGPRPFGGKIKPTLPPLPTCIFKKVKVGDPMPIEAYIVDFGPINSIVDKIEKIPVIGKSLAKPLKKLLETLAPTKIMKYEPISFFEWSLGNTWPKTFSKPFFEGLKLIPPPFNIPFSACDSNAYIIKFIGTSQNISF